MSDPRAFPTGAPGAEGGPDRSEWSIVEAVQQLSPEERRRLLRRLRAAGVLEHEELLTDRNRLQVAPALGLRYRSVLRRQHRRRMPPSSFVKAERDPEPPPPIVPEPAPSPSPAPENYRSPVSGRVVVGTPDAPTPQDPHTMAPLPGQAPEQPIVIIFDGGSRGNPGQGYGSYALRWPGQPQQIVQLRFGDRVTNNEAEYDTLIAALEAVLKKLQDAGAPSSTATLEVRGDSLLVVNQVLGAWEAKEPRLQVRRQRARELFEQFGHWRLIHHAREHSVKTLGH